MRIYTSKATSVLAVCIAVSWCTLARSQDITVGVIVAATGPAAVGGIAARNALELWPTEIAGHKVKLIVQDDRSDPSISTTLARRLATEDKVDVLIGSTVTPGSVAAAAVAAETRVPHFASAPIVLNVKENPWTFGLPQTTESMARANFEHMNKMGVKSVGYIGFSDVWGDQWLGELKKYSAGSGIKIAAEERFGRGDTSVSGQTLRLMAAKPDAILVGASVGGAGLVQKTLVENGYKGTIYHTHGTPGAAFARIAGAFGEGAIAPISPSMIFEQLPNSNPMKAIGSKFVSAYETRFGAGSRTPFAGYAYTASIILQKAVPDALLKGKPGTREFRDALRLAIESVRELPTAEGVYNYSSTDHHGTDQRARALVVFKDGGWKYLP